MTRRLLAAGGAAFVALSLAGNSLTESAVDPGAERSSAQAARDLASYANSTAAQVGIGLEILGLVALVAFAAAAAARLVLGAPVAAAVVATGGTALAAIKLASGAPLLAGIADHDLVTGDVALALLAVNGAAFVLSWVPLAMVVAALAAGLRTTGAVGLPTAVTGGILAVLGLAAALLGVGDVNTAMPVPFLLSLIWITVVSVRLTMASPARQIPDGDPGSAPEPTRTTASRT
jgi:hypothetical protein